MSKLSSQYSSKTVKILNINIHSLPHTAKSLCFTPTHLNPVNYENRRHLHPLILKPEAFKRISQADFDLTQ
jgi:hypothetical protein